MQWIWKHSTSHFPVFPRLFSLWSYFAYRACPFVDIWSITIIKVMNEKAINFINKQTHTRLEKSWNCRREENRRKVDGFDHVASNIDISRFQDNKATRKRNVLLYVMALARNFHLNNADASFLILFCSFVIAKQLTTIFKNDLKNQKLAGHGWYFYLD